MSVDPVGALGELIQQATTAAFGAAADPLVRRSERADLETGVAHRLARTLQRKPEVIAAQLIAALPANDLVERAVNADGHLNVTLRTSWLDAAATRALASDRLGLARSASPECVVIDYSAPNVAKEMHVGHLRSTIIGDALARVLELRGHRVIRQNHLGDWGTPFGMLIEEMLDAGIDPIAAELDITGLSELYRHGSDRFKIDDAFAVRARARVVALQAGEAQTVAWWRAIVARSHAYIADIYARLGVTLAPADICPESFYNPQLPALAGEVPAVLSDGALCLFPAGFTGRDGAPLPLIVRKGDGGFGYAATDLAALRYRITELGATRLIYVVGAPQSQHLAMVFTAARELGWLAPPVRAEHAAFGSVLGSDKKILRSRAGKPVRLAELIDEAIEHALVVTRDKAKLDPALLPDVARMIGIGSIKFVDLANDRIKDYVFDLKRMVTFKHDSAGWIQYNHARCRKLLRDAGAGVIGPIRCEAPEERALAFSLALLDNSVAEVDRTLEPHRLARQLSEIAERFNDFYEECPVLDAEGAVRASRLALVELAARSLQLGCNMLGIEVPVQM